MRIEAHDRLGQPIVAEVTRIVIYNDYDQPIAVAVKQQQGWLYVGHCRDPEFFDYLQSMGIQATYVVETLDPRNIKPMPKRG